MTALLTPRRPAAKPRRGPSADRQESLFGAAPAAPAVPAPPREAPGVAPAGPAGASASAATVAAPEREAVTSESAHRHGPTLDDLVAGAWEDLMAGAPAACLACGTTMHPRYSAGAGVVGGRCGGCGSSLS
ncbi:MAG: hypothetical protein QOE28_1911 [Solirubrobacteraceae bacterium]|jgi:hypothetical protein|nr:hypothetical protein [Solirubrobacteraceae bacterium]